MEWGVIIFILLIFFLIRILTMPKESRMTMFKKLKRSCCGKGMTRA